MLTDLGYWTEVQTANRRPRLLSTPRCLTLDVVRRSRVPVGAGHIAERKCLSQCA